MSKGSSLSHQVNLRLNSLNCIGQKKHAAKEIEKARCEATGEHWNPSKTPGIHSIRTMDAYRDIGLQFTAWAKSNCPDLVKGKTLSELKPAAVQYIKTREAEGKTPWTLAQDRSALAKLIGTTGPEICDIPQRHIFDRIKNIKPQKGFSEERNRDLVDLCRATGLRRHELKGLTGANIGAFHGRLVLQNVKGKGGKVRTITVCRADEARVIEIFKGKGRDELVITKIPTRSPCHIYRRDYVQRRNEDLRRDGLKLQLQRDKIITKDLGHERTSVMSAYRI